MRSANVMVVGVLAGLLSACGGGGSGGSGGGGGPSLTGSFKLTVNTTGLATGESYVIQDSASAINVSDSMTVSQDGAASFPSTLYTDDNLQGVSVSVTITQQPADGALCVIQPTGNGAYQGDGPPVTSNGDLNVSCSKYPAVTPVAYPQVTGFPGVTSAQVIASPQVVPIFFTNSTNVPTYQTFLQQLLASQYWGALKEYGVNAGALETAVNASTSWPATVNDAQVRSAITSNNAWGASLNSSTVLVLFLPAGTSYVPDPANGEPAAATGEHGQISVGGVAVQFVVAPADNEAGGAPQQFGAITKYLVNAITNPGGGGPNIGGSAGYVEATASPDWWSGYGAILGYQWYSPYIDLADSRELASACSANAATESDITLPAGYSGGLPGIWSNKAAAGDTSYTYCGRQPYGVVAQYPAGSTVTATRFGHTFTDTALIVPAGGSASVTLTAWSTSAKIASNNNEPYFPLAVNANKDWVYLSGSAAPVDCEPGDSGVCASMPSFTLTPVQSANGQTVANCCSQTANGDTFTLQVTMPATAEPGLWVMYVGDQPIAVANSATWQ
jgi:hypothetical protein